ncbi:hypothetical protein DFH09DRAFT_1112379 [Mycena vulgaris]|nr:hypothetical protein DFH09DRAFT_1112379 [Mycena vulgaris]
MWDELGKRREAQAAEAQAAKAEGAGSTSTVTGLGAAPADCANTVTKVRLRAPSPTLVDVKRMAAGRPPGYISFYDRKIAQFKARDKRRALLKLQREAPPKRPLRRGYRHPPVNFTQAAGLGKDLGKTADAEGRAEADLKEEHRLQRLRVAYLLSLRGVPINVYGKRPSKEKVSGATTRIRWRRRGTEKIPVIVAPAVEPKPGDTVLPSPGYQSVPECLPAEPTKDEGPEVESPRGWDGEAFYQALIQAAQNFKWERVEVEAEASASPSPEETEKDRAWATATRMCIDGMREPDRREWLDMQARLGMVHQDRVRGWHAEGLSTQGVDDGVCYAHQQWGGNVCGTYTKYRSPLLRSIVGDSEIGLKTEGSENVFWESEIRVSGKRVYPILNVPAINPGQPDGPIPGQKIYLVTGRNVRFPGAYVSWLTLARPSADSQYKSVSGATIKGYRQWSPLESAWFAGCDRGEHEHTAEAGASCPTDTPSVRSLPPATRSLPPAMQSALPLAPVSKAYNLSSTSPCQSPSKLRARTAWDGATVVPPDLTALTLSSPSTSYNVGINTIPGRMAYAVKHGGRGAVFNQYSSARELYHRLEADGESPTLASCASLTEGICFVEGFSTAGPSAEAGARRRWIEEELTARTRHVAESWGKAMDNWRMGRDGVWRSDSDESDDSDESSVSESTEVGGFY